MVDNEEERNIKIIMEEEGITREDITPKRDTEFEPPEPPIKRQQLRNIKGLFKSGSSVPTHTPRNFHEQFFLYKSETDYRFYVYINDGWKLLYPNYSKVKAYISTSNQTIGTGSVTTVEFNAESYDEQDEFDSSSTYRFTAKIPGDYLVIAHLTWEKSVDQSQHECDIYKNGGVGAYDTKRSSGTGEFTQTVFEIFPLVKDDYIWVRCAQTTGGDVDLIKNADKTFIIIHKI